MFGKVNIAVGDVYEDCAWHPVFCTESDGDDVAGVSLYDGSSPRSCSIHHCGVTKLSAKEAARRVQYKKEFLAAEAEWRKETSLNMGDEDALLTFKKARDEYAL